MRPVDPHVSRTATRRPAVKREWRLRPTAPDVIDAAVLCGLCLVGLVGFSTTFQSMWFLAVAAIGLGLGVVSAHLVSGLRWPWWVGLCVAAVWYVVAGGAVALRRDIIAGVWPSRLTVTDLADLAIHGWKHLLTTVPPVAADSEYLVLPWLLALLVGVIGYAVARATPSPSLVLIAPVVLFGLVILLSRPTPGYALAQGLGGAVLAAGWAVLRAHRRRTLIGTGAIRASRVLTGAVLAIAAGLAGVVVGPVLPGTVGVPRVVLRNYVQPPIDVSEYPSPLPGFVKFASAARDEYFDTTLLTTTGLDTGAMLRIAVLDSYNGLGWSASGTSVLGSGFKRVGAVLPTEATGPVTSMSLTVTDVYAGLIELNPWIPAVGPSTTVTFEGEHAKAHLDNLAYDADKGQALVTDLLQGGDTVKLTSVPVPWMTGDDTPTPGGVVVVPSTVSDFAGSAIDTLAASGQTPWEHLMSLGRAFRDGFWSDGTRQGEGYYLPGNGQGRLTYFFAGQQLIGSDEQYAAAFALAANRLGFPARVVFGARVEDDGSVKGKDVLPWVEVDTSAGWLAVPTELYIPDRDRSPEEQPPDRQTTDHALTVPPPRPTEPPGALNDLTTRATAGRGHRTAEQGNATGAGPWVARAMYAGGAVGGLVAILALLAGVKAVRTVRRRTRGSPAQQIAGGWQDVMDRVRDLGYPSVSDRLTRREQAGLLALAPTIALASGADRVMFSASTPDAEAVRAFWDSAEASKRALMQQRGWLRRFLARVSPRSLAHANLRTALGAAPAAAPVKSAPAGRTMRGTQPVTAVPAAERPTPAPIGATMATVPRINKVVSDPQADSR